MSGKPRVRDRGQQAGATTATARLCGLMRRCEFRVVLKKIKLQVTGAKVTAEMTVTDEHLPNSGRIRLDCGHLGDEGGKERGGW